LAVKGRNDSHRSFVETALCVAQADPVFPRGQLWNSCFTRRRNEKRDLVPEAIRHGERRKLRAVDSVDEHGTEGGRSAYFSSMQCRFSRVRRNSCPSETASVELLCSPSSFSASRSKRSGLGRNPTVVPC